MTLAEEPLERFQQQEPVGDLRAWKRQERQLKEDLAVLLHHRGLVHQALQRPEQAAADFQRAEQYGYESRRRECGESFAAAGVGGWAEGSNARVAERLATSWFGSQNLACTGTRPGPRKRRESRSLRSPCGPQSVKLCDRGA